MTTVAPQDPDWSAAEIAARRTPLGFKGVQINSHTQGEYLDEPKFDPIFRALADTGQPLYIHPATPPDSMIGPMLEAGLDGAIFGFGVDTGMHLLRLITTGIFDRYPDLQIMVGHMPARRLPYWAYRLDFMHQAGGALQRYARMKPLKKTILEYLALQCAHHHQRHGVGARDPICATGAGRGSRDVRHGLSLPICAGRGAHA